MKLITIFDDLRIWDKRYTLANSFCHFSLLHDRTNFEDPIAAGMYAAVLFMTWKLESWDLYLLHPMQREIRGDTYVSTYFKSDCKEFLRSPLVVIRIDVLIICVTAQLWNIRDHILFDGVSWLIYLLGSECIFVMCNIRDSPDLILGRGRMLHKKRISKGYLQDDS